jgi:hypothetical protein
MDPTVCSILFLLGSAAVSHQVLEMPSSPAASRAGTAVCAIREVLSQLVYHIPSQTHHVTYGELNADGVSNLILIFVERVRVRRVRVKAIRGRGTGRPRCSIQPSSPLTRLE